MSYYKDDQERLRKMREALQRGTRPTLQRPGLNRNLSNPDPYKHNSYINGPTTDTRSVQGPSQTGSLLNTLKSFTGTAPSTKKDHLGNKPGFDLGDIPEVLGMGLKQVAPLGTGSFIKGMFDPAAKEGTGLKGLNAKAGANFRAGVGDVIEGTGNIMKWVGDKTDVEGLHKAGEATTNFAGKNFIDDYERPYSKEFTWKSLMDPEFYASSVSRSMPFMLSMIVPGAAGYSAGAKVGTALANTTKLGSFGKNVIRATAGGVGGMTATAPFESAFEAASVYEEALGRGMSEEEADAAADSVFKQNLALLGISNVPELMAVFAPGGVGVKAGLKQSLKTAGKIAGAAAIEGGQEVGQEFISSNALGDKMDPAHAKEAFAIGALMGGGMSAIGKLGNGDPITMIRNRVNDRLSDETRAEADTLREEMRAQGAEPEEVESAVFDRIAETEEGQTAINEATQEIITKLSEQSDEAEQEEEAAEPEGMDVDEFNPGDTVFVKGMSGQFEVMDNSDPSMLVLKNKYGNELKVGRQAVSKDTARKDLGNAMESAVMNTAKQQVETLPDSSQEPAGEEVAPEQVQTPTTPEQLREEVTQAVNEMVDVQEQPQQRPDLRDETKAQLDERDETMKAELPGYLNGFGVKDFKKGDTVFYRHPRTGALVESKVTAAKGKDLHVQGFSFHGDQIKDYVFKQDESYVEPQEQETDVMDEYEDYGDESLEDLKNELLEEHQAKTPEQKQDLTDKLQDFFGGGKPSKEQLKQKWQERLNDSGFTAEEAIESLLDEQDGESEHDHDNLEALYELAGKTYERPKKPKQHAENYNKAAKEKEEKLERENANDSLEELANTLKDYPANENAEPMKFEDIEFSRFTGTPQQYVAELNDGEMPFIPDFFRRGTPVQTSWFLGPRDKKMVTFRARGEKFKPAMPAEQLFNVLEPIDYTNERHLAAVTGKQTLPEGIKEGDVISYRRGGKEFFGVLANETSNVEGSAEVHNHKGEFDMNVPYNDILRKATYEEVPPRFKKIMPKPSMTEKYEEQKDRINDLLVESEEMVRKDFEEFRKRDAATDYRYDSEKDNTTLWFDSPAPKEAAQALDKLGFKASQQMPGMMTASKKIPEPTVEKAIRKHLDKVKDARKAEIEERNKQEYSFKEGDKVQHENRVGKIITLMDTRARVEFKDGIKKLLSFKEIELMHENAELTNFEEAKAERPFYETLRPGQYVWHKKKQQVGELRNAWYEGDTTLSVRAEIGFISKVEDWNIEDTEKYEGQESEGAAAPAEEPAAAQSEVQTEEQSEFSILGYPAVMEEGKDTRNNNPIWKVKITEKVSDADLPKVKGLVKKFGGKFYNARHKIKEIAGWNIFTKKPEGIFDHAETQAAEESGAKGQEAAGTHSLEGRVYFSLSPNPADIAAIAKEKPEYVLVSFANWGKRYKNPKDLFNELIGKIGYRPKTILDSGAYSFRKDNQDFYDLMEKLKGKDITNAQEMMNSPEMAELFMNPPKFMEFMDYANKNEIAIDKVMSFDVFGDSEASDFGYKLLKAMQPEMDIIPVFQAGSVTDNGYEANQDFSKLDEYAKEADIIAIGGTAIRNVKGYGPTQRAEIVNRIIKRHPNVKFHLLGSIDAEFLKLVPGLYSTDGATWVDKTEGVKGQEKIDASANKIDKIKQNAAALEEARKEAAAPNVKVTKYDKARDNLAWLDALADNADAYIKKNKNRMSALPVDIYAAGVIVGARKMAHGMVDFAEWSESMIKDYGQEIRLSLKGLYAQADAFLNDFTPEDRIEYLSNNGMSELAEGNKMGAEEEFEPNLPDFNNPEYTPVPSVMDEIMKDEETTEEPAAKSYNEYVLDFAGKLAKKKVFLNTVKAETTEGKDEYGPKEIIQMFEQQVRADVSAEMMDYLNEPTFDSDVWNKLTGEVGIRQIINNAIMNVKEGVSDAKPDTVRTDGQTPLAGTQTNDVPATTSERNPGSETVRSTGNSETTDRGTDGERDEPVRSTGNGVSGTSSASSRGNRGKQELSGPVNYRLSKADITGIKGKKTTAEKNLEIIKLAKQIQEENRPATEEEKKKLVQFVGWGGLKPALEYEFSVKPEWKPFLNQLKEILTPEELDSARRSRLFAHYTAVDVIEGMYDGLQHLGFDGGRLLEPAAGIGHFIGMLPDSLADRSRVTAVEIEPMTAQIGRLLYPKSDFRQMGFEKTKIANDFFDVAIGNVPFNEEGVFDKDYKPSLTNSLHNYFFVKSLDKVREGGLVMFITSSYTMDSKSKGYRKYLANRAELVGAIRLPNNAFKDNAGTEVTTDIVILKKLPEGQVGNQAWVDTTTMSFPNPDYHKNPNWHSKEIEIEVNKYFEQNPNMVIGEITATKAMYGNFQSAAVAKDGMDIKKEIAKRFKKLPKVYEKAKQNVLSPEEIMQLTIPAPKEVKEGAFHFQDNRLYIKDDGNLVPSTLTGTKLERVKGLITVRNAVRELFYAEIHESSKAKQDGARKKLNTAYDAFVKKHGPINSKANVEVFQEDPDFYVMSNIENYDKDTNKATKGEIFTQSTIARYEPVKKADNAREAMAITLNETGNVNLARIKELTGLNEPAIMSELEGLVFVDPVNHKIMTKEEYLSGNVRAKLAQAETAVLLDDQFKKNVDALKEIVPTDISAEEITAPLGAPWIPAEYVRSFVGEHLMGMSHYLYRNFTAGYSKVMAEWKVAVSGKPKDINADGSFQARWGHPAKYNTDMIEAALNNADIKVTYKYEDENGNTKTRTDVKATAAVKEKVAKIRDEWVNWVWTNEDRKNDLVRIYNDTFNSHVLREYDGSHLTFPNMNPEIAKLFRPYQKNAVYRATQGGNTLFAHAVGAGKTFEMIASMMELKRLGLAKKPMWVVPNHLVQQSAREFNALYPSANVLVPSKKDLNDKNRKNYLAKIATRNFDVIIVPHSSFGKINVAADNVRRFMQEQINQLEEAIELEVSSGERSDKRLAKTMENAKIRLENKMEKLVSKIEKDSDTASFEELGIDSIVLDEAHEFKNLMFATRRTNVGGLGNSEGSGKAFDLFMKVRYLNELNGGRGVIFATGTPISNSLAEMYHMMRYLAHDQLEQLNVNNFDAWANLFADIQNVLEMAPEGNGYRMKNKVKGIYNAPELLTLFRSFADVKTTEELLEAKLIKHPKTIRHIVEVPANPALEEKVAELVERAERVRKKEVAPEEDNMLKITNEGRYAALDVRILDPDNKDYPDNKVNYAKAKIVDVYKRTKKEKGTQLVFVDLSTPGKESDEEINFSVYNDLKNKLVRSGIARNEIAFIHDAKNDDQKQAMFDKVNSGEIRVLIGSSSKMGAGMNVQKRLKALHHIDVPWRPSDIEQREGRILRHGNVNEEVEIYNYVQSGSFDSYMWQLIEAKAKIINRVMSGDLNSRTIEDDSEVVLNASKMKAIASGDERVYQYEVLKMEVQKLELSKEEHVKQQNYNKRRLHDLTQATNQDGFTRIGHLEYDIENYTKDKQKVQDLTGDKFKVTIGETTITNRTDAGKFLFAAIDKTKGQINRSHKIGEFSGFDIQYMKRTGMDENTFTEELWLLGDKKQYPIKIGDEAGTIRSMEARLPAIDRMLEERQTALERLKSEIKTLESLADATFQKEAELQEKLAKRNELQKVLSIDESQEEVILSEEEAPATTPKRSQSKAFAVGADAMQHNITPKTAKDVSDKLANVMNTVLRTGSVGRRGAAATYTPHKKTGNIKDKYLHNIRITAHELGHAFEEYGFEGDATELIEAARQFYPAFDKLKKRDEKISEGKAELFTMYVLKPDIARQLAPITVEEIENVIADNKALDKTFKEIRELIEKDKGKAVFEKGLGSIALPSEEKKNKTIGDEYYIENVPEDAEGMKKKRYELKGRIKGILTKLVDYKIPFADMQKERTSTDGKDLVKMLATTGNAEIKAQDTFTGWARDQYGRYIINYKHRSDLPDYMMDTYDELNSLDPASAKADTPLIERYKEFYKEHNNKEQAILEAISSRSLQEIVEDGMLLIQNKIKGHNVSDALKEEAARIKKENKENPEFAYFTAIIQAYRAGERYARRDNEGNQKFTEVYMAQDVALNVIEATQQHFPGLEEVIREYTDNLSNIILTKLVNAGVTTEEARARIEEGSGFYIPTYYAFKNPSLAAEARERKTAGQPIKGFQGKQAEVIDFARATIYKLMEVEQSVEFKQVLDEVEKGLREEGMGKFGEILPQNRIPQSIQGANIAKQVSEQLQQILGDDAVTIDQIEESIVNNVYTVFFPTDMLKNKAPILMNWHGQKKVYMRIAPDLYNSIRSMQPIHVRGAMRILSKFSSFTRHLAIMNPRYFFNVISRDLFSTQIQRNVAQNTIKGFLKGAALSWGKDQRLVDQYINSGAFMSAQENIMNSFRRGSIVDGLIDTKAKNWKRTKKNRLVKIINPSELLQWQEQINRYGSWEAKARELAAEYNMDVKKIFDGREPLTDGEFKKMEKIILELGYEASEVTTNFRGHGTSEGFRKVTMPITFLHGTIQGLYREAREFKTQPKRVFQRSMLGLMPITMIAWAMQQALDDDSDDITSEMKDKYWIFPVGNTYVMIAKPFGYALPFAHVERFMDHLIAKELLGKEEARSWYEDFWNPGKHNLMLPFLPIYGRLALDLWANKTWYGGQIVPMGLENAPKDLQFDADTSLIARFQADVAYGLTGSEKLTISPKKFDYAARQLFGEAGKITLNTTDNLFGKETAITKNPFKTDQELVSSRSVKKFYDNLDKMEGEHKRSGEKGKPAPELKRQREAKNYMSLFKKVEQEVKLAESLSAKEKLQYQKKIADARRDLSRVAAGREPNNRENLMEIVTLAERYKDMQK